MFRLRNEETVSRIATILAACWLNSPMDLAAQSPPQVLVVVTEALDAECVKRIGREQVHVELLLGPEADAHPINYEACNKRVRDLLEFRLLVFRGDAHCPSEGFWRERMIVANPRGKIYRMSRSRRRAANAYEHRIQQATDIHGALASILPERRATLDANLESELNRLHSLRIHPAQFALRE